MKYFGTDGFRGRANEDLNVHHAFKIGRFLGDYFNKEKKDEKARIVIGKDTRRSSYMFESALSAGITASGADAYLLHVTTTPSVSYIIRTEDFDCGIMISASHNPYYDNGIKLLNNEGYKMEENLLEKLEEYIDSEEDTIELAKGADVGRTVDYVLGRNRYIAYLSTVVRKSFKGYKVLLDVANGSAFQVAKNVFNILGADVTVINDKPDGYNINLEAGSTHVDLLQDYMKTGEYDVAFAYDGDSDRCLCVDEKGNIIDGDAIIYILGKRLKEIDQLVDNTVVATVMSNIGLFKAMEREGINTVTTSVGDKYISEEIKNNGYSIGAEQSGHVIISKYSITGDGILTSLKILETMIETKMPLSLLTKGLVIYPQLLKNVVVADKEIVLHDKEILDEIDKVTQALGDRGRILVRPSGTEPKIRVMVEAETDEECTKYVGQVVDLIEKKGYAV